MGSFAGWLLPLIALLGVWGTAQAQEPAASAPPGDSEPDEALPHALGLADAEAIFQARGLDLLIAEYGAQGAEGDTKAAGAHPNPGLSVAAMLTPASTHDVLYPVGSNVPADLWGFNVGLTDNAAISDQLSGKRPLRIEATSKALASARLNVEDVRRLELSQLRQAYVTAVMAKLNVDAAQETLQTFDQQQKLTQKRFDDGAATGLDVSRVKQAQLEAQQALASARSGSEQALATLLFLLGVRSARPTVELTTGIEYAPLPKLQGETAASLVDKALASRTDVKVALSNAEQTQVVVRQAHRAAFPDLQLQLGYSEQCSQASCSSEPAFNLGVQGNLPVLYQQQGEIQRAEGNARIAQRTLDKARAQVLSDVDQGFAAYQAAQEQVQRMEGQLLDQAKLSRDLAQAMYQNGAASLLDFLDAQRAYVASRLEYHQDLANYWTAVYALQQATGLELRQ